MNKTEFIKTTCPYCGTGCGLIMKVENGMVVGTYPDREHLVSRGALCISEAIKNQDKETGVTLMVMDALLDHGPLIAQTKMAIDIDDDTAILTTKLTQAATQLLADKLPEICAQNYSKTAQDESLVVFTPSHKTLTRQSAFIPFDKILIAENGFDAPALHALVRSLNPEPGSWTSIPSETGFAGSTGSSRGASARIQADAALP